MTARIKSVVAQYLPGMKDAQWRVAHAHAECTAKHHCPTAHLARLQTSRPKNAPAPRTTVVTLSKTLRANARAHRHYARLTLDESGAVIKLAVSR
jgi:hypothetical protein